MSVIWISTSATATSSSNYVWASSDPDPEPNETFWTPEPVMAYRAWTLRKDHPPSLRGFHNHIWSPGKQERARCVNHSAPFWGCLCGYNAIKDFRGVHESASLVTGLVALTGQIHEYELGYRAEYAEIAELYISDMLGYNGLARYRLHEIHLRYQVPVFILYQPPNREPTRRLLYGNG